MNILHERVSQNSFMAMANCLENVSCQLQSFVVVVVGGVIVLACE